MEDIIGNVKIVNFKRLEELKDGLNLFLSNMYVKNCHGKERYIIKFENIEECSSNYWLEKEIQDRNINFNLKIKIEMDTIKTTPSKRK